jgi:hypothetical protein
MERTGLTVDIFLTKLSAFSLITHFHRLANKLLKAQCNIGSLKKLFFELLGIEGLFTDWGQISWHDPAPYTAGASFGAFIAQLLAEPAPGSL